MGVTIQKEKAAGKTKQKGGTAQAAALIVDQLGELEGKIEKMAAKLKPLNDKYSELATELLTMMDAELAVNEGTKVKGEFFIAEISEKGKSTDITDMDKVAEILEQVEEGLFMNLVKVNLGDIRKYMTPKQLELCTAEKQIGKRRIKLSNVPE